VYMLTGPIMATEAVLRRASLTLDDIDTFEVDEAFASVVLACAQQTGAALDRRNVNGAAIVLGHPVGAGGAIPEPKLICEMRRTGARYSLQAMCEGGGQANSTVFEQL
jgi:acetyl-CoA C-acetyltransferase